MSTPNDMTEGVEHLACEELARLAELAGRGFILVGGKAYLSIVYDNSTVSEDGAPLKPTAVEWQPHRSLDQARECVLALKTFQLLDLWRELLRVAGSTETNPVAAELAAFMSTALQICCAILEVIGRTSS